MAADTPDTLAAAIKLLRENMFEGVECPCCNQFVKMYRRKLNTNMTLFLIDLVRLSSQRSRGWVKYTECRFTGRDYNYLPFWNLAVTKREDPGEDKTHTGDWKPTQLGIDFVLNEVAVESHLWVYNNEVYGCPPESRRVFVTQTLGSKFSYQELMGALVTEAQAE